MDIDVQKLTKEFAKDLGQTEIDGDYDTLYLKYFSKTHGLVTKLMKDLPKLGPEEKRKYGPLLNQLQNDLKIKIDNERKNYKQKALNDPLIDLTLLEPEATTGKLHPLTETVREMNNFFRYYGFSVVQGPEIETAEFNFRKLNLPEGHPATDLQDTLFICEPGILLRTHTSSIESRTLSAYKPPIRAVAPGKVFRNETASATNSSFFHHYQGFVVEKGITIQNLKGIFVDFHKFLFGEDVVLRFRYKYYPEVSPGLGTDMQCVFCHGEGCPVCKYRGWIEVLGSGMIHYNTLKSCGIDPEEYTGFAFGMGLDRLVMQKYGIDDIRKLYGGGLIYA
jgi:phenylalanyl-tRNA synthetase alpha chain